MRRIVLLFVFLALLAQVSAQEIREYRVDTYVTDTVLREEITLTLINTHEPELEGITYPFNGKMVNLTVFDSIGTIKSSTTTQGEKTYASCTFRKPLLSGENYTITYSFYLEDQISKKENAYILSTAHSLLANVKNFYMTMILPEGYGVAGEGVSPLPQSKSSDGRRVILNWKIEDPIPTEFREFKVIVIYEKLIEIPSRWLEGKEIYFYLLTLIVAAALVVLYVKKITKGYLEEKIEILKEDEQAIMKMIIDKNGIDQREIQRQTDFSKAKVSKILSELEKRGAIRKETVGRRNKIYLADKIKET